MEGLLRVNLVIVVVAWPYCQDVNASRTQIQRRPNEKFLAFVKRGHGLYCPRGHFCGGKVHDAKHGNPMVSTECSSKYRCRKCNCDENCARFEDCCPDKRKYGIFVREFYSRIACKSKYINFLKHNKNNDVLIAMVNKCPKDYSDDDVSELCENTKGSPAYLKPITPVTDGSYVTYANEFCAQCNGAKNYTTWSVRMGCRYMIALPSYKTHTEILQLLWRYPDCYFSTHISPSILNELRSCDVADVKLVSRCNVTGQWRSYNADIKKACDSYTSIFDANYMYRNPFCFMCNSDAPYYDSCIEKESASPGSMPTFSDILNFNLMAQRDEGENNERSAIASCPVGYTSDNFNITCKEIHCFPGKWLQNEECKTVIIPESGTVFKLETSVTFDLVDSVANCETANVNLTGISHLFYSLMEKQFAGISGANFEADLITYLPLTLNVCESLATQLDKYSNKMLIAGLNFNLNIIVRTPNDNGDLDYDLLEMKLNTIYTEQVNMTVENVSLTFVPGEKRTKSDKPVYETAEIKKIHQSYQNYPSIHAHQVRICPHFIFSNNEFEIKAGNLHIHGLKIEDEFFQLSDDYSARVCISVFTQQRDNKNFKSDESSTPNTPSAPSTSTEAVLTLVLTCISIACLFITICIYSCLPSLRTGPGLNNIALAVSIMCAQILFQFGGGQAEFVDLCRGLGIAIHYAWLSALFWMNVCSVHMFRVFTFLGLKPPMAHNPMPTFLLYALYAQGIPIVFIVINICISMATREELGYGSNSLCFISEKNMLGQTFALPCGLIIVANTIMFICVIVSIHKTKKQSAIAATNDQQGNRHYGHVYFRLSTLTGVTWIFGFLYQWTAQIIFSYFFIVLNAAQGIFISVAFICNKRVLNLMLVKCGYRKATGTIKTSLTTKKEMYSSHSSLNKNRI